MICILWSICPVEGSTVILACRRMLLNSIISYRALISVFMISSRFWTGKCVYIHCLKIFCLAPRFVRQTLFVLESAHLHKQWLSHRGYLHRGRLLSSLEFERGDALIQRISTHDENTVFLVTGKFCSRTKAMSCATPVCPSRGNLISTISLLAPLLYE